ncbi:MAG: lamin tail domain-containing protein [Anaerolineales bacterium]|nr:lamin tail domain-containing protein [Anaerolineales bacterium]
MQHWKSFPRFFLLAVLLIGLLAGISAPALVNQNVKAAPVQQASSGDVIISEFRFLGPAGADDEFIELYNPKSVPAIVTVLNISGSNNTATFSNRPLTPLGGITLQAGQHYLLVNSGASAGLLAIKDATYASGITADGGIALIEGSTSTVIDAVGLSAGSKYLEGAPLTPLSGSANQSYERKNFGCTDTDNNSADFVWNQTSSNPQNSTSTFVPCLRVIGVTSTAIDDTYFTGDSIAITVTFSNIVDVTGFPTLLLETGVTHRNATYVSGTGTSTLTFNYTVVVGDVSSDLDYVATNSLSLNGGTIIGAAGNANLTLPSPGTTGSLGNNKAIVIDNGIAPSTVSFTRQTPLTTPTNASSLIIRVTFSEPVTGVSTDDFVVTGATGTSISITTVNNSVYDVAISGGDLTTLLTGIVGLDLSNAPTITDLVFNPLPASQPAIDETYTLDKISPTVTVEQAIGQADPASTIPVNFTVVFSEAINASTFTTGDITQTGTISSSLITWIITDSGDHTTFNLSATAVAGNGTLIPILAAGKVTDDAGNNNAASPTPGDSVTFNDNVLPTVTINQAVGQIDPSSTLPINFSVVFSEPIIASIFTSSDIIQSGTALGIVWSITDSGNHMNFTLSATAATSRGTIVPSIPANRVTDLVGNTNTASISSDNFVSYIVASGRTATPTATSIPQLNVIINEVAWSGTFASPNDEWIELYNPTSSDIDLTQWKLTTDSGSVEIFWAPLSTNVIIRAGGYYLIERGSDNYAVSDIAYDKDFSGSLSDDGEVLRLVDSSNRLIDIANSDGGVWPAGSTSTKGSMERVGNVQDGPASWATNTGVLKNGLDAGTPNGCTILVVTCTTAPRAIWGTPKQPNWAKTVTLTPSRTPPPTSRFQPTATFRPRTATPTPFGGPVPVGRPFINEFLPRPGFDWNLDGKVDTFDEFIELKNVGNADMNLSGWRLDDSADFPGAPSSAPYTIPDLILKPGEYAVFYASQTNILLSDGGDSVRLFDASGDIMDVIDFTIAKVEDESVCRLPDGNGFGSWFNDCTPTPNLTNARDGQVPTLPEDNSATPFCALPDTLPEDFLFAECRGYGANIWDNFYWDEFGWMGDQTVPDNLSKWESFVE